MENKVSRKALQLIVLVFILCTIFIFLARAVVQNLHPLEEARVDFRVLLGGNVLLFGVTAISFLLYSKALRNNNPHVFVRMMYGSLLVKMFACLLATLIYAWFAGRSVNKNAIFGCFGLYVLYTWLEVKMLMAMSKKSPKNV